MRESDVKAVVNKTMNMTPKYDFSGTMPCTDGKVIFLPNPATEPDPEKYVSGAIASGLHECLHLMHSDFKVFDGSKTDRLWFALLNCLEDARINRIGKESVISYDYWRSKLIKTQTMGWQLPPEQCSCEDSLVMALLFRSHEILDALFMCDEQRSQQERYVLKHEARFSPTLIARITEILREKLPRANGTGDAARIVDEIVKALEGEAETAKSMKRSLKEASEDSISMQQAIELSVDGSGCSDGSAGDSGHGGAKNAECERTDEFATIRNLGIHIRKFKPFRPKENTLEFEVASAWKNELQRLEAVRNMVKRVFSVKTESKDNVDLSCEGDNLVGILDWAATRSLRIYGRQSPERRPDAEVCILLDRSGSMGIKTMAEAKLATYALSECVEKIKGCTAEIFAFPGIKDDHLCVCKTRTENISQLEKRFECLSSFGSTPIQEATIAAYERIRLSEKKLKLVVLVTDGRVHSAVAESTFRKYRKAGIELALLSIGIDNSDFFPTNYQYADGPEEIVKGLCRLLQGTRFRKKLTQA